MAKTDFKTIDEYQAGFPPEIVERMEAIRAIIHKAVPKVEETISYQIPFFKYQGYLISYCAFAKHLSLSYPYTQEFLKEFKTELAPYKMSKSIIQFPHSDKLPLTLIKKIIQFRKEENEANPKK